jgi:hypothetical protein
VGEVRERGGGGQEDTEEKYVFIFTVVESHLQMLYSRAKEIRFYEK